MNIVGNYEDVMNIVEVTHVETGGLFRLEGCSDWRVVQTGGVFRLEGCSDCRLFRLEGCSDCRLFRRLPITEA